MEYPKFLPRKSILAIFQHTICASIYRARGKNIPPGSIIVYLNTHGASIFSLQIRTGIRKFSRENTENLSSNRCGRNVRTRTDVAEMCVLVHRMEENYPIMCISEFEHASEKQNSSFCRILKFSDLVYDKR